MFKKIFEQLCINKNVAPTKVCRDIGLSNATYSCWTDESVPRKTTLFKLAEYFDVSVDYLLGKENTAPAPVRNAATQQQGTEAHQRASEPVAKRAIRVPVYDEIVMSRLIETASIFDLNPNPRTHFPIFNDRIAAGIPFSSISEFDDFEEFPADNAGNYEYVALRIHSDAMEPRITPGDIVIVRVQRDVDNGDVAVVTIGMNDFACKKIKKTPEGILLISANPKHEPIFYSNQQIKELPVRIFGKVVELRGKF